MLKDGTIKYYDNYYNWVFSGDKTEHQFKNPLTEEQKKDRKNGLKDLRNCTSNHPMFTSIFPIIISKLTGSGLWLSHGIWAKLWGWT